MPIFDNELINNQHRDISTPNINLASPGTFEVDTTMNMGGFTSGSQAEELGGLSLDELSELPGRVNRPTFDSPFQMVPKGELIENKRYALYERDKDLENIYGINQSWAAQLGNGIAKMGATAAGTFAQSFATLPNTISAIKNGDMTELSGLDGYESDIDKWLKNIEDVFPNYVTRSEQKHPFLAAIPGFAGSANFWGDSIIKNIGFTVGAIGGALAQDAIITATTEGIGTIPLISAQLGKASLWLNKVFTGTNDLNTVLRGVNATEQTALNLARLQQLAAAQRITTSARYLLNLYGASRTEAAIEARDGYESVHSALVDEYNLQNLGAELTADEAAKINEYAENAMNTRFGINMAILTLSNAIQFDNILKPFSKALQSSTTQVIENAGRVGLAQSSLDTFERQGLNTLRERIWDAVKPKIATVFAEGVWEEGGQYAAERGTYDYYTRKYKNPSNPRNVNNWDTINEVIDSTVKGLSEQFNTNEGIKNMLIGAISSVITGGLMGKIDSMRGRGKDARLQSSINILNNFGLTGILQDKYGDTVDAVGIARDMEEAAKSGDVSRYRNYQHDMFFNFVSSRIPSGMHDITIEQLNMLKELDQDQFFKMFGIDYTGENQQNAALYVDALIDKANNIKEYYDALDRSFKNPFTFRMDPKSELEETENRNYQTFNSWKTDLAYFDSISKNVDTLIDQIGSELLTIDPNLNLDLVTRLTNPNRLIELAEQYEEEAATLEKSITEFTSLADKRSTKAKIKFLRTQSEKINLAKANRGFNQNDFSEILNFENSRQNNPDVDITNFNRGISPTIVDEVFRLGQDVNALQRQRDDAEQTLKNLISKEGFEKYFDEAERIANNEEIVSRNERQSTTPVLPFEEDEKILFRNSADALEEIEIDREYEKPKFKKPAFRKISDNRFRVTDSLGNQTFYSTEQAARTAIADMVLDDQEITRIKVIGVNNDRSVKVEDKNGNIQNIPLDKLRGFTRLESEQEKLIRNSEDIKEQQDKITINSGSIGINTSTEDTQVGEEGKLKDASILFTSSVSVSEDSSDPTNKSEHVKRSREFLNNVDSFENRSDMRAILVTAKQIEAIGLSGLIQMSFNVDPTTALNDIPQVNDIDNGFVAQVFVIQENGKMYFTDKNGNKLTEVGKQVSMDEVVFQTMPTTSLYYPDGTPRFRQNQQTEAEGYAQSYREFRQELFASPANEIKANTFNVSRGIPIQNKINGISEKNHVGGILLPENLISTYEGLIVIPTTGVVSDNNGNALTFPKGTPVLKFGSNIQFLNNRQFNNKEANTIFSVIEALSKEMIQQSRENRDIQINVDYATYLQNVLYWRKEKTEAGNQINIDPVNMVINIGKNAYPIANISSFKGEIVNNLQDSFIAVNNKTLGLPLSENFYEYIVDKNGNFSPDNYVVWDNYQSFLLSSKTPDGKTRDISNTPLSTSVAQPTESVPYSFKQKYSTVQGMELSIPINTTVSQPEAQEPTIETNENTENNVSKIGNFNVNDGSINIYEGSQAGPVEFKATLENDIVTIEVVENDTIDKIASNTPVLNALKAQLTALNLLEKDMSEQEIVETFLSYRIAVEVQQIYNNERAQNIEENVPTNINNVESFVINTLQDLENLSKEQKDAIKKQVREQINNLPDDMYYLTHLTPSKSAIDGILSSGLQTGAAVESTTNINASKETLIQSIEALIDGKINHRNSPNLAIMGISKSELPSGIKLSDVASYIFDYLAENAPEYAGQGLPTSFNLATFVDGKLNLVNEADNTETFTAQDNLTFKTSEYTNGKGLSIELLDSNNNQIGVIDIQRLKNGTYRVEGSDINNESDRNKGLGFSLYEEMAKQAASKNITIYSDDYSLSPQAESVWKKLIKSGLAEKVGDIKQPDGKVVGSYRTINPNQRVIPKGTDRFSGFNPEDVSLPDYRAVGQNDLDRMDDESLQIFRKWHAENVPNIPFEVLDRLVTMYNGEKAWGIFEDGVAKFVRGGLAGTEYHEIFEGIFKAMLSEEEQEALLTEFKGKKGSFIDRPTGQRILYSDATDLQAKERIADDFSDFRLGKLPARNLTDAIKKLFNRIVAFIKSFLAKRTLKDKLFEKINTGGFRENVMSEAAQDTLAEYRAVEGLPESITNEFVQDMTARAAGILYSEGRKSLLFTPESITSKQMFATIEAQYLTEKNAQGFNKRELLGDQAWRDLQIRTLDSLNHLGISFNEDDRVNINNSEANKNDYVSDPFTTNWKASSTGAIKFSLATLLEVVNTNQEKSLSLELPKPKRTSIIGFKLLNFSRTFATVLDKLSNTTKISEVVDKLSNLAGADANYVRLFQRVGGNISNRTIPFETFSKDDWRYYIQFTQTFTKQKPDALIQYISGPEVYTAPANIYTAANQKQRSWIENMKAIAADKNSLIRRNFQTKTYQVNRKAVSELPTKTPAEMVDFLNKLGIDFTIGIYNKLKSKGTTRKTNEQIRFAEAVQSIKLYLGENEDILSVDGKTLGINSSLSTLSTLMVNVTNPNQESTYFGVNDQQIGSFSDNNAPSLFENEFNESDTLEDLLVTRPELNDIFSTNSQILKKGGLFFDKNGQRIKEIKVGYIQGTRLVDKNKGTNTSVMTIGERFVQEINQNINGNYYVLIPADGSTEWMMNLGNVITYKDVVGSRGNAKINSIFKGYLLDDVAIALDGKNRNHLKSIKGKEKELRFFKDILSPKDLKAINNMIAKDLTRDEIEDYINANISSINDSIQDYINYTVAETKNILLKNSQIVNGTVEGTYDYSGLDDGFTNRESLNKFKLSEKQLDSILYYVNTNYTISNIEYHKFLFGDPLQFAVKKDGSLDETKRIKSFLSPRRTTFDSPELNSYLNRDYNKVGDIMLTEQDPGYHQFKPYTNTVTLSDVITVGSLSNTLSAYSKNNEADAASWVMGNTYREIKIKNGQWSDNAEKWHQWQMAYTRQNMPGYKYTNNELQEYDKKLLSTPEPYHKIEVLKPIVSGTKYNTNQFDLILDKLSQMPMYYKMVQGRTMENLFIKMQNEGIGYVIMESGRKVGAESLHSLYNPDGTFNETPFNNIIKVSWKSYGIQVETSSEGPKTQTRGSQLTKISSMDLFSNGVATSPEAKTEYENNKDLLDKMHQNAYKNLIKKLGVIDTGNGFTMENGVIVSNTLMHEMTRRAISENAKDAVTLDENGNFLIPFEAAPSYVQIKNILYSMIDKALISPKMNGGAHVQIPATMFEDATKGRGLAMKKEKGWEKITREEYNKLSEEDKKKVMITDENLKFYTKEDPYCEIMIPHWFKGKLGQKQKNMSDEELIDYLNNSRDGKKILQGIGFRIPTQALSSVETFRVKGFLPQYMGSSVIVPSEITTKAGSDFDIDKLNMYLKSIYIDRAGDIKLVEYFGSREANDAFYTKVFNDTLQQNIMKKYDLLEAIDIAMYNLPDPKNLLKIYGDLIEELSVDYVRNEEESDMIDRLGLYNAEMRYSKLSTDTGLKLEQLTDENLQESYRQVYLDKMYKSALENAYYTSLEKLITLPENFNQLIQPIGDAGLEALASKLDNLRGYDETAIRNRILNRNYLTSMRNSFLTAKRWVGIAAVNITGLAIKQKSQVYLDSKRMALAPYKDRVFLGDGIVNLPHNTINIDGFNQVSLSGSTVAGSNELISDRLSGYATAFVDVAKGDYITKIIRSNIAVGTFMFLENIGVGDRSAYFMNQPIISEYLNYLDSISAKNLFAKKHLIVIRDRFFSGEEVVGFDISQESLEKNISDFYTKKEGLSDVQNAEQLNILDEFLKYAKMAEFNFKFTQAINYDTSSFRSAESFTMKQWKTQEAEQFNILNTASAVLNNTFIGEQAGLISKSIDAMGAILKLDNRDFRAITDTVLNSFTKNPFISGDTLETLALQIKTSFLDYIIQTKSDINSRIHELLVDNNTAVVHQLEKAKINYPGLQILRDLEIVTGNRVDGAKSVKLVANIKDSYDENLYVGLMRELRDHDAVTNQLYKNLVNLSILQGTASSTISIRNIIPIEDFSAIVGPIVDQLQVTPELNSFSEGMFQRNNFRNDDIAPIVNDVRFFKVDEMPLPSRYNALGEPLGEQFQFVSPYIFPTIQPLGISTIDRKIMLMSEKYNSFELQNDFLKIPRIYSDPNSGELIDMKNGISLIPDDFRQRKLKGDPSLYDVYIYQRVKLPNNENLIHSKLIKGKLELFHVYKLVNVYGDSNRAVEHYNDNRQSVIDNGGVKTDEIPNSVLIEYYGGAINEKDVSLQSIKQIADNKPIQQSPEWTDAFEKTWERNAYNILEKYPDFTREQYESMSEDEKDNLLGCI